ncbi:hypothetical protein GCM10023200_17110 [Actinomycetospora chlora]|uniref:Uncharacterized protein n=1 Tax=Actinomycetospora chlora TaxID=663608 RepID=A0ABP9AR10_9PSEU
MGRRRRGGQRRAAKVEARRRRREVTTRPPRRARHERAGVAPTTPPPARTGPATREDMATLLGEIVAGLDLEDEWADEWDDADEDDDLEDDDGRFEELEDEVRLAVARTVREHDLEVARTLVADAGRGTDRPFTGDRVLIDLVVDSWLRKAGRRRADVDLPHAAVAWVAEHLGEDAREAATILGPTAPGAWMADFLRTPDDVLVARLWLLAAVVALAPGRDAVRMDVLGGVTP